jgi:hypothetical protein
MRIARPVLIRKVWLKANQYTGIRKNEKCKRNNCMVDDFINSVFYAVI